MLLIPAAAEEGPTFFTFSNEGIEVSSGEYDGYKIKGTELTINAPGIYALSGECENGSVSVKKGTQGVTLILSGLSLTSEDTAPIVCGKSTDVIIEAAEGTENFLSDTELNNSDEHPENENAESAVIKAKNGARLTLAGTGSITVTANGKNGVKTGETTEEDGGARLTIKDLTLTIASAKNDGIKSDSDMDILSGDITVRAADDGIKCAYTLNIGAEGEDGPRLLVAESKEAVEASEVNIYSGETELHAQEDGINASNKDLDTLSSSFACNIYGGSVYIDVPGGDGIDSNGTLDIYGGTVQVFSAAVGADSPLDAERGLTFRGGTTLGVGAQGVGVKINDGQGCLILPRTRYGAEGALIEILSPEGETLFSAVAPRRFTYVVFSSPELEADETYTVRVNGAVERELRPSSVAGSDTPGGDTPGGGGSGSGGSGSGGTPPAESEAPPAPASFGDVEPGSWYSDAVAWAVENGITTGVSDTLFAPDKACTRAEIVTFLYRAALSPDVSGQLVFEDVEPGSWYDSAVLWAVQNGVTAGVSDTLFAPEKTCTRAEAVTFLYRAALSPAVSGKLPFEDVESGSWYEAAVVWALGKGITTGVSETSFAPEKECTRAEIVTLMYRAAERE
ncbi:MAG: carbohydrate-binding domain-containing protein [Oscillospiraceae bacterium]|nr:carbohydrate-binding domain-containing protein [Oscillospiraceae bacterium]